MENLAESVENPLSFCVECKDQEAAIFCEQCDEDFCEVCHGMLHRTGNRRKHTPKSLRVKPPTESASVAAEESHGQENSQLKNQVKNSQSSMELDGTVISGGGYTYGEWLTARAKTVPLRLDSQERNMLRLLDAALNVSEYTDKIDIISYTNKAKRIFQQIKELCAIISGLLVAGDYKLGNQLFAKGNARDNEDLFQRVFEVGRRFKIMNPEKMRSTYGKLMHMLMDSVIPEVEELLGFSCVIPIKTVYDFLKQRDSIDVLHDDKVALAIRETPYDLTREQVNAQIQRKRKSIEYLCTKYANDQISATDIERCLASLSDNHAYLKMNRDPCERMIKYLSKYFNPAKPENNYSLAIIAGRHGHRLTHTHSNQYAYVHQSLTLWCEMLNEMFMLWSLADSDLLSSSPYRLTNTGQGLQRIQTCPGVSRTMQKILGRAQKKGGSWIGSCAVHLGDKNVPNSFTFIDKYNQVSRILTPIVSMLDKLDALEQDEELSAYMEESFGGIDKCKKDILYDFFRFGFNGSGADNYFDAGSWCSMIEKKDYFPVFLLTGFIGFDGGGWN
ncbi:hypothetical protein BDF14DRAFT_1726499 [Spinellus fusiger]|nr:hypothetical protein BDF14DRAFT_1726499 [Spinellus fusiger]